MIDLKADLWRRAEPRLFITKEEFFRNLEGWTIEPIENDGEVIAITAVRGPEMHFETVGTGNPIPRRIVFSVLQKIIDQYGYALTKTPKEEIRQQRFNALIGWKAVGEDFYDIHYRIERLRGSHHERTGSCPS